jgi:hypothetical protein
MGEPGTMQFEGMTDNYSKDSGLSAEFTVGRDVRSELVAMDPVREILHSPDIRPLVEESRIIEMLEHDAGMGMKLGDSKSIRTALADAATKIEFRRGQLYGENPLHGEHFVSRDQEMAFRRECLSIIKTSLMEGRSKFIARTGKALPGW